jgi:hypothetical protein
MKWVIGLFLMALYQYWVYDRFWIVEDNVKEVKQATYISGEIQSIDCVMSKKIWGQSPY